MGFIINTNTNIVKFNKNNAVLMSSKRQEYFGDELKALWETVLSDPSFSRNKLRTIDKTPHVKPCTVYTTDGKNEKKSCEEEESYDEEEESYDEEEESYDEEEESYEDETEESDDEWIFALFSDTESDVEKLSKWVQYPLKPYMPITPTPPESISTDKGEVNKFSVLSYNICRAVGLQNIPYIKWNDREKWVKDMIDSFKSDIICLQEARCYSDNKPIHDFMAKFPKYDFITTRSNTDVQAVSTVTAWNRTKFVMGSTQTKWFSSTPNIPSNSWGDKYGRAFSVTELYPKTVDGKILVHPIRVINVHVGLEDEARKKSYELLANLYKDDVPTIMCGDFNFFPHDKTDHSKLFEKDWDDSIHDNSLYDMYSDLNIPGSFTGFSYDANCTEGFVWGMLDGFYTRNVTSSYAVTSTDAFRKKRWVDGDLMNDDLTSDHLPLFCFITVPLKATDEKVE